MKLENDHFRIGIAEASGAIESFHIKSTGSELIGEKRLASNFRILLPIADYQCNYIDGMQQTPVSAKLGGDSVTMTFRHMDTERGSWDVEFSYTIQLRCDSVVFSCSLTNHTPRPVSELWFPRIGGWNSCFGSRDASLTVPGYTSCRRQHQLFRIFPGSRWLGPEAAEFSTTYPGMVMPWWDIHDGNADKGLLLVYLDTTFRYSTWHSYLVPNTTGRRGDNWPDAESYDEPTGMIFSHVRYPFTNQEETFESGEFVIQAHDGDWHRGSLTYRNWFMGHFPFDKKDSWLRRKTSWFTSILHQPEDRIVTNYEGYDQWCRDAESFGIDTHELIGWDKGGLERDYPEYVPEERLGGREAFRTLLTSIHARKARCLVFVNYNVLDSTTELFAQHLRVFQHQDSFGMTANWMAWGESTLTARKGVSVHRHVIASVTPAFENLINDYFLRLVRDGADAFQIDKLCVGSLIDHNPTNSLPPDTALCEGIVQAIDRLLQKCREIRPDFRLASEAVQDRLLPYVDVYYRSSDGPEISSLRYVFPEWTSCQHIGVPEAYDLINGGVLTGSVLVVEPEVYQSTTANPGWLKTMEYIVEVERIRKELFDVIFLSRYLDSVGARVEAVDVASPRDGLESASGTAVVMAPPRTALPEVPGHGALEYRVHAHNDSTIFAIVVANMGSERTTYAWSFVPEELNVTDLVGFELYEPFGPTRSIKPAETLAIDPGKLQIIVGSTGK